MAAFSPSLFDDAKVQKIREITKYFSCKRLLIICLLKIVTNTEYRIQFYNDANGLRTQNSVLNQAYPLQGNLKFNIIYIIYNIYNINYK